MDSTDLFGRLDKYGADLDGINDRFMGDAELYEQCFNDFLCDDNFNELHNALQEMDSAAAFQCAHALKGLSGNLGLTPFYDIICELVEPLRAGQSKGLEKQTAAVYAELDKLRRIGTGETAEMHIDFGNADKEVYVRKESPAMNKKAEKETLQPKTPQDRFLPITAMLLILVLIMVIQLFIMLVRNYRDSITSESAEHLVEINNQLKLHIEQRIENDWQTVESIANSIANGSFEHDDDALLNYIRKECDVWQIHDIIVYTEKGGNISARGDSKTVGAASKIIVESHRRGSYMTIVKSDVIFTMPVNTTLTYDGSKVAAISVIQDLEYLLDNMQLSSFGGTACLYLTQKSGETISFLSHPDAIHAYNLMSALQNSELTALTHENGDLGELLTSVDISAFLIRRNNFENSDYLVVSPIKTRTSDMRLFYTVPESVVNNTLNSFGYYITLASIVTIAVFAFVMFGIFVYISRERRKKFDKELRIRERMFEYITRNSETAFGLIKLNADKPLYLTGNAESIVGTRYISIAYDGNTYSVRDSDDSKSQTVVSLNEEIKEWDGISDFTSGYILNDASDIPRYFKFSVYPTHINSDEYIAIAQNVTKAYEREMAVCDALNMAERANEAKSRFLSNMSHDIRTPMNAIVNMTQFAIESIGDSRRQLEYLHTIEESSEHLLRIINDVLDMSRIESGFSTIESAPFDLMELLKGLGDIVRPLCEARHQIYIQEFDEIKSAGVIGDRVKVSQILMNLLSNAVKFTPDNGAVRFAAVEIPSLRQEMMNIRFTIEDNGIGISAKNIEHIFEPFMRVDDKRVSKIEGTGLGLSICNSYVQAMGGTIKIDSAEGDGTTFTVELFFERTQLDKTSDKVSHTAFEKPFIGLRALLCEDNTINQVIAKRVLERLGFIVDVVSDGSEAVQTFNASKSGYYDVIYMDIQMPVMDGYTATVTIREGEHPQAKSIPIIAMTANIFVEDIEKARIAGMNAHVGKPIITIDLVDETERALKQNHST